MKCNGSFLCYNGSVLFLNLIQRTDPVLFVETIRFILLLNMTKSIVCRTVCPFAVHLTVTFLCKNQTRTHIDLKTSYWAQVRSLDMKMCLLRHHFGAYRLGVSIRLSVPLLVHYLFVVVYEYIYIYL